MRSGLGHGVFRANGWLCFPVGLAYRLDHGLDSAGLEDRIRQEPLPVLREVVTNGENGILLPSDAPDAWAAALRRLGEDPAERQRLGDFRLRFITEKEVRRRPLPQFLCHLYGQHAFVQRSDAQSRSKARLLTAKAELQPAHPPHRSYKRLPEYSRMSNRRPHQWWWPVNQRNGLFPDWRAIGAHAGGKNAGVIGRGAETMQHRVPSDEPHAHLMRCRGDQRLGHVDAVMANHNVLMGHLVLRRRGARSLEAVRALA